MYPNTVNNLFIPSPPFFFLFNIGYMLFCLCFFSSQFYITPGALTFPSPLSLGWIPLQVLLAPLLASHVPFSSNQLPAWFWGLYFILCYRIYLPNAPWWLFSSPALNPSVAPLVFPKKPKMLAWNSWPIPTCLPPSCPSTFMTPGPHLCTGHPTGFKCLSRILSVSKSYPFFKDLLKSHFFHEVFLPQIPTKNGLSLPGPGRALRMFLFVLELLVSVSQPLADVVQGKD